MPRIALLFPGQGSQSVGMGQDFYQTFETARAVMDEFDSVIPLSPPLTDVMFNGPEETLKRTLYTQPGIAAVYLAAWAVLREHIDLEPVMAAGHSLGEYGALVAGGVISIETAAKLIQYRAQLMEAAPPGAMAAILGLIGDSVEAAVQVVAQKAMGTVTVANYNTPEQTVISGEPDAVAAACEEAKVLGASKTVILPVGGAFHSPLMIEADQAFSRFAEDFTFENSRFPIITNVDAQPTTQGEAFCNKLGRQISHAVRWVETLQALDAAGVDTYIELGPGRVLTGMMKRSFRHAALYNMYDAASLNQTVAALKEKGL